MNNNRFPYTEPLGDRALLVHFGAGIDAAVNARVHAAAQRLRDADLDGVEEIAPAYASLCVVYDPLAKAHGEDAFERVRDGVMRALADLEPDTRPEPRAITLPVCYGGEFGPDLQDVARHSGLDVEEVIRRHHKGRYTVAMLGFAPGFAYLLGMDARLATPRLDSPRTRVPAGAVAIGGEQTGVYPRELPGGWRIIGRTPRRLFDADRDPAALLQPGDQVQFEPVDAAAFERAGNPS